MSRYRHEDKYIIDEFQKAIISVRADGVLTKDSHAGDEGYYIIRSIYLDDLNGRCYYENLNGTDPRAKYRIRYYGNDVEYISLEKKTKRRGMTLKESARLSYDECTSLMQGNYICYSGTDDVKRKLLSEVEMLGLAPRSIVTYKRIPYIYRAGNVRITFDSELTSSNEINRFLDGDYRQRPVFSNGSLVLEVKWDEILPRFIKDTFHIDNLQKTAFSKYSMCRAYHL